MENNLMYVLVWKYPDNSASGIYQTYKNKIRAHEDLKLAEFASCSKTFELIEVPYIEE